MHSTRFGGGKGTLRHCPLGIFIIITSLALMVAGCVSSAPTPTASSTTHATVKSGNWSDATVWSSGVVPADGDSIRVGPDHILTLDEPSYEIAGLTIDSAGTVVFSPDVSITLSSSANIIVNGKLVMRPASAAIDHTVRFTGIDEADFVGGGMDPTETDVGLWVMGAGQLNLQGTKKSGWLRFSEGIDAGATSGVLESAPIGWAPGDEITIAPTEAPTVGDASYTGFDNTTLATVAGSKITWQSGTSRAHPEVNNQWTAEVANLTRNVRIEGASDTARSHVFIRSSSPQVINHVGIRYMGPRQENAEGLTDFVVGRYGLHFHYCTDGSRGSQVIGTVIRDVGSHGYVPHRSHGIWFRDTVAFNTLEDAYWWDPKADDIHGGDETHDILLDHAMAALVRAEPEFRGFRHSGFNLAQGLRNSVRDSVAVGVQGNADAAGFQWPESAGASTNSTVWDFSRGNIAHNNAVNGFFVWQNTHEPHVVANFALYHNGGYGIQHGAYGNNYHYENGQLYGNAVGAVNKLAVTADQDQSLQQRYQNIVMDGAGISDHLVFADDHTFSGKGNPSYFRNITLKGARRTAVRIEYEGEDSPDELNFEFPNIQTPSDVTFSADAAADNIVRIQNGTVATEITKSGRTTIPPFAQPPSDHSRPQISIASPIGGAAISGTVNITSYSYDDFADIDRVELFVDGIYRGRSNTAPYTVPIDTVGLGDGMHVFELRVFDNAGRANTSHKTSYWVTGSGPAVSPAAPRSDTTKPSVDLFTPDKNGHVSGWYQMTSGATDNFGVRKVEYYASGTLICTDDSAPFDGCLWNSWNVPNGNYLISAEAYDFAGNVAVDDYSGDVLVENTGSATEEPAPLPPPLPPPSADPTD
jgi:hypothetical protein